jgi:diguanylate cyclase (GGDEF)-like protein
MICKQDVTETKRIERLRSYDVIETSSDESLDRITRLAGNIFSTPISALTLVDADKVYLRSRQGLDAADVPRNASFCAQTIERNEPLLVTDALQDPRFRDGPLVAGPAQLRFYAGAPLIASGCIRLGALAVFGREPLETSGRQIEILQELARFAVEQLEFRKTALTDSLTGLCLRRSFSAEAARQIVATRRIERPLACLAIDVDRLESINTEFGRSAGDIVLQAVAETCKRHMRKVDTAGRIGGATFGALLPETGLDGALHAAERLRRSIADAVVEFANKRLPMSVSIGATTLGAAEQNVSEMMGRAECAMRQAKELGRNQTAILSPPNDEAVSTRPRLMAARR